MAAVRLTLFPVTATPPSSLCSFNPLSRCPHLAYLSSSSSYSSSSLSGKILSPNSNLPVSRPLSLLASALAIASRASASYSDVSIAIFVKIRVLFF